MKQYNTAELIHWAESCNEIEYEYSMHSYWNFRLRVRPDHVSPMHWCKRDDIVAAHCFGALIGYDHAELGWSAGLRSGPMYEMLLRRFAELRKKYPELENKNLEGQCGMHQVCTSVIEVAEDGLSARASFYTPGIMADNTNGTGFQSGCFMWERYGTDWIYDPERADWGTWHNQVAEDFSSDLDCENPASATYEQLMRTGVTINDMMGPTKPSGIDIQGPSHIAYSPVQVPQYTAQPPMPYDTISHTSQYIPYPGDGKLYVKVMDIEGVDTEEVVKKAFQRPGPPPGDDNGPPPPPPAEK